MKQNLRENLCPCACAALPKFCAFEQGWYVEPRDSDEAAWIVHTLVTGRG